MSTPMSTAPIFEKFPFLSDGTDSPFDNYYIEKLNKRLKKLELRIKEAFLDTLEDIAIEVQDNIEHVTPELERKSEKMMRDLLPIPDGVSARQWLVETSRGDFTEMTKALIPFEQSYRTKVRNGLIKMSEDIGLDLEDYE